MEFICEKCPGIKKDDQLGKIIANDRKLCVKCVEHIEKVRANRKKVN